MSRVTTSNYGAQATTQFAWATTDADQFDRELDLYHLSQAVELHDHSAGRGLPAARLATDAVSTVSIAALSVTTDKIANLAVTNGKLAEGAVTRNKITWPLVQFADNMPGSFSMRDTTNTYAVGFYVATNGLAVFGSGTIASIPAGLIIDQSARTSIGPVSGSGKLNVFQAANTQGSGFRLYHTDQNNNVSMYMDAALNMVFTTNLTNTLHISPSGFMTLGPTFNPAARFYIVQASGTSGEGFRLERLGGAGLGYVLDNGAFVLQTLTTAVQIEHTAQTLSPLTTLGASLGSATFRWANLFVQNLDISGTITGAGSVPLSAVLWFPTAATLTAAGASWAAYAAGAGRILIGAGTTFTQAFAEATNYGANWTPGTSITYTPSGTTGNVVNGGGYLANTTGGTTTAFQDHQHPIVPTNAAWLPPMRAGVWGQRIA